MGRKLLVIQVAALGYDLLTRHAGGETWAGLSFHPAEALFPALTCPIQATFRTATLPAHHGVVANGFFDRTWRRVGFWEQAATLVAGPRLWQGFRAAGHTVGMLFWQQSLGEEVDVLLSPWPVHRHGGGLVDALYAKPAGLDEQLTSRLRARFHLRHYWGPLAGWRASAWITHATVQVMRMDLAPDLLFTYVPHLDYVLQRAGPEGPAVSAALADVAEWLGFLWYAAVRCDYDVLVFGDYAIGPAQRVLFPNRVLAAHGLLATRLAAGRRYANLYEAKAFALVDHEVAHVYLAAPGVSAAAAAALATMGPGFRVLAGAELAAAGINHANAGDLVLVGEPGTWFAYPWWEDPHEAPDYAGHIDIHNKPGYDPGELFWGWPPWRVSQDVTRVRGTHGAGGPQRRIAWASTLDFGGRPATVAGLAIALQQEVARRSS